MFYFIKDVTLWDLVFATMRAETPGGLSESNKFSVNGCRRQPSLGYSDLYEEAVYDSGNGKNGYLKDILI